MTDISHCRGFLLRRFGFGMSERINNYTTEEKLSRALDRFSDYLWIHRWLGVERLPLYARPATEPSILRFDCEFH